MSHCMSSKSTSYTNHQNNHKAAPKPVGKESFFTEFVFKVQICSFLHDNTCVSEICKPGV